MFAKDFWHRVGMSPDPQRFATRVLAAFKDAGNHTEAQIARAEGPSTTTMTKLRKVAAGEQDMSEPREPTWTKIDTAAQWAPGSARRVWDGGEPTVMPRAERIAKLTRDLARIQAELERLQAAPATPETPADTG